MTRTKATAPAETPAAAKAFEGAGFEDAAPEALRQETAADTAARPCQPLARADGLTDCAGDGCNFLGGRTACGRPAFGQG